MPAVDHHLVGSEFVSFLSLAVFLSRLSWNCRGFKKISTHWHKVTRTAFWLRQGAICLSRVLWTCCDFLPTCQGQECYPWIIGVETRASQSCFYEGINKMGRGWSLVKLGVLLVCLEAPKTWKHTCWICPSYVPSTQNPTYLRYLTNLI